MSMETKNAYMLIDGVLDDGLPFVAAYLERMLNKTLIITDHNGQVHYPDAKTASLRLDETFVTLPRYITENETYYDQKEGCFYYHVGCNGSSAYVVITDVAEETLPAIISIIRDARLAIKCYFSKVNKSKKFEGELLDYLLSKGNRSIKEILKLSDRELDWDAPYFVFFLEIESCGQKVDWQLLRSYSCAYLKRMNLEVIPVAWPGALLLIIPVATGLDSLEADQGWPYDSRYKELIEKKFIITTSQGVGQVYPLRDLYRSFYEAHVAITLPRLMGKRNYIQYFSDLGLYYPIFSQDSATIQHYCHKILGPIIEHDVKTDGELFPTLCKLLDSGVNMKATADSLFIHVNTLYYRVNKIEQILEVDLSRMDARVDLYTAVKVYQTLVSNGLWINSRPVARDLACV